MFSRILVPVDGSAPSRRAEEAARELALKFGGALLFLSVWRHHSPLEASLSMVRAGFHSGTPDEAMRTYAREIVTSAKDRALACGVTGAEGYVQRGNPAREIVNFSEKRGCDAIIMGSRGTGGTDVFMLGSVSHKVSALSSVTCVLVK